jgi:hypothetical protein
MKSFDRYSIRGIVISLICLAGIVYEVFFSSHKELFVIVLYTLVLLLGLALLFYIKDKVP